MPRAELTLTIPDDVWIGDVSRTHADTTVRVLAALPGEESGVGLAEVSAADLPAVLRDIESRDSVHSMEVLSHREGTALIQFETSAALLLDPVQGSGIPLEMPFTIEDGNAVWEVTAPQHRLSELGEQLSEFGIPFSVERVQRRVESERLLTETQLELLEAAVETGYYDTPRTCSLTELAETVGIAKSTCSETLHRAEEAVIKQFVDSNRSGD